MLTVVQVDDGMTADVNVPERDLDDFFENDHAGEELDNMPPPRNADGTISELVAPVDGRALGE